MRSPRHVLAWVALASVSCSGGEAPPPSTPAARLVVHAWGFVEIEAAHDAPSAHVAAPPGEVLDDRDVRVHLEPASGPLRLTVAGTEHALEPDAHGRARLSYRATLPRERLPLEARVREGMLELEDHGAPRPMPHVTGFAAGPGVGSAVIVRSDAIGTPSSAVDERAPDATIDAFLGQAAAMGLTADEIVALTDTFHERVAGPRAPYDVLYYWLGGDELEQREPLTVRPTATEVRRAYLVHVVVHRDSGACAAGAGGASGRSTRPPRVRLGEIDGVSGSDRESQRRALRTHLPELRACYESSRLERPDLAGGVELVLALDAAGRVREALTRHATLESPEARACLLDAARTWSLAEVSDGAGATIVVPVVFDTASE